MCSSRQEVCNCSDNHSIQTRDIPKHTSSTLMGYSRGQQPLNSLKTEMGNNSLRFVFAFYLVLVNRTVLQGFCITETYNICCLKWTCIILYLFYYYEYLVQLYLTSWIMQCRLMCVAPDTRHVFPCNRLCDM